MPRGRIRAFRFLDLPQARDDSAIAVNTTSDDDADNGKVSEPYEGSSSTRDALRMESYEILDLSAPRCLVLVKSTGEVHQVQASRLELAARFQIPQRDLRLLDPWVPVPIPVSFLVRKHAILANFGAVRVLISRCECAILSSGRVDDEFVLTEEPDVNDKLTVSLRHMSSVGPAADSPSAGIAHRRAGDHWHLPFELRMLETALDEACSLMGVEVRGVVASATSRMAVLQASVPAGNSILEELKEIRSEAVKLSSRVGKFKSELEDVMHDDSDMLDMYLQRRHVLSTAPAQLQGTRTLSASVPAWRGSLNDAHAQQGQTATFMPSRSHTHTQSAEPGRGTVSFDDVRPAKNEGASASAPAAQAPAGSTGRMPSPPLPPPPEPDVQPLWTGTASRSGSEGAAVAAPAGFGSAVSAMAVDVSDPAQGRSVRVLEGLPEKPEGEGADSVHALGASDRPFAIGVGPPDSRTEPLPSPFTAKGAQEAGPEAVASVASRVLGPRRGASGATQARSMEVDLRPSTDDAPGPPAASQSLEPATSIPDRVVIGQRARRAARIGKHGWDAVRGAGAAATRIHASRPQSGATTPERAATATVLPVGSPAAGRGLRQSQTMLPQRQAGRRQASTSERRATATADAAELHSVRSFSTDAEAVQLTAVPVEDPNEEAARMAYLRLPRLQSGVGLSMANASAPSMPHGASMTAGLSGRGQGLPGVGWTGQLASVQTPHSAEGAPAQAQEASPGRPAIERSESATSSSSRSTEILNHLLDLKLQAEQANAAVNPHDIQDVENMLEAYSLQLDYYMAQLGDLSEFIEDFQDDIQVDLDKKRNALFAGQLLITLITAGFSFIAMMAGIFGMNLKSGLEDANGWFLGVTLLSTGLAGSVTIALVAFLRYNRMLFLGD